LGYKEKRLTSRLGCAGWPKVEIEGRCDLYQLVGWLSFSTIDGRHIDKVDEISSSIRIYGQNAPIRYAPEQELKSDVSNVTNSIQLPGKTKMYMKVWNGKGSNESFLDFVMTSLGLIKRLGHWKKLEEADDSVLEAEESVKESKTAYKVAKERVQQATTSSDEEPDRETQQANLVFICKRKVT
jgi:hypothetical protein